MFASDLLKYYHWVGRKTCSLLILLMVPLLGLRHFHSSMWAAGARRMLHNLWPTEGSVGKFLFYFTFANKIYSVVHFSVGWLATGSKQLIFLGLGHSLCALIQGLWRATRADHLTVCNPTLTSKNKKSNKNTCLAPSVMLCYPRLVNAGVSLAAEDKASTG